MDQAGRLRPWAGLVLVGLLACEGPEAAAPVAVSERRGPIDPSPDGCARCHAEVVAAWRTSMHARAWDDPVFRSEYEARPAASCRECHAPASAAPGRSTGVDCASCHLRDDTVLASAVTPAGLRAHAMRVEPTLRGEQACARCHQFAFTDDGVHDPAEALQNTIEEHHASAAYARGDTCVTCHMPRDNGSASHRFPGIHDPRQLARAVEVEVDARRDAGAIEVTARVRGRAIGHAFPTGDVFRGATLRISTPGGQREEIVMQRWLARTADADGRGFHVRTVDDTRVPPPGRGEVAEQLRLVDDGAGRIEWELVLHRLPPERAAARGLAPEVVTRTVQRGVARWLEPRPPAQGSRAP